MKIANPAKQEEIIAYKVNPNNRNEVIGTYRTIEAWTKFTFPGRNNTYSDFNLDWSHFNGIDYDDKEKEHGIFRFYGKHWSDDVDKELGNYDYLMGCDVDFNNLDVVDDLFSWGKWFLSQTNVDGFRLDAIKHIRSSFYKRWLHDLKNETDKDLFTVGYSRKNSSDGKEVSAKNIKDMIKEIIDNENKKKPLSDEMICTELSKKNLNISRRTVAKYREESGIKKSFERKEP